MIKTYRSKVLKFYQNLVFRFCEELLIVESQYPKISFEKNLDLQHELLPKNDDETFLSSLLRQGY